MYVVITPAHNERTFIERTLQSMVSQSVQPRQWVIVDDASTDGTAEVVERYTRDFSFIKLVRKEREPERNFARKVAAFNCGLEALDEVTFDFIGNIDADMSFSPDYFKTVLDVFERDSKIGISGGIVFSKFSKSFATYDYTLDSVGGKVQLFRRECFDDIGGYRALKFGGIDATAEVMARMNGWKVQKCLEAPAFEHRPTGFAYGNPILSKMCEGRRFYSLGYDPLFYFLRCVYRLREYPFIIGSAAALMRYLYGMIKREAVVLPDDVVAYLRREQREKLLRVLGFQ